MKKQAGVYKIENLANGKCYYGSSIDLNFRKIRHFSNLKLNKHPNKYLQNSYNKHGVNKFKFEILHITSDKYCRNLEQWYLDNVVSWGRDYNITTEAIAPPKSNTKKVYEYTIDGLFIKEWESCSKAARFYNINRSRIRYCALNEVNFKDTRFSFKKLNSIGFTKERFSKSCKSINIYDLWGDFLISFPSRAMAARYMKVHRSRINNCLSGNDNLIKNYIVANNLKKAKIRAKLIYNKA